MTWRTFLHFTLVHPLCALLLVLRCFRAAERVHTLWEPDHA